MVFRFYCMALFHFQTRRHMIKLLNYKGREEFQHKLQQTIGAAINNKSTAIEQITCNQTKHSLHSIWKCNQFKNIEQY